MNQEEACTFNCSTDIVVIRSRRSSVWSDSVSAMMGPPPRKRCRQTSERRFVLLPSAESLKAVMR